MSRIMADVCRRVTAAGFETSEWVAESREFDKVFRITFLFHCPCGRPIRETLQYGASEFARASSTQVAEAIAYRIVRELRKHIDEEAKLDPVPISAHHSSRHPQDQYLG